MKIIFPGDLCLALLLAFTSCLQAQTSKPKAGVPQAKAPVAAKPQGETKNQAVSKVVTPAEINAADLAFTANISARELRFEKEGEWTVKFSGQPERQTIWAEQRQNFPKPAQPGVTYRDIGSQLQVVSRFANIEQLFEGGTPGLALPALPSEAKPSSPPSQSRFPAIPAPLPPLPVSAAPIPSPKAVLPPKPVLPLKPWPTTLSQAR